MKWGRSRIMKLLRMRLAFNDPLYIRMCISCLFGCNAIRVQVANLSTEELTKLKRKATFAERTGFAFHFIHLNIEI